MKRALQMLLLAVTLCNSLRASTVASGSFTETNGPFTILYHYYINKISNTKVGFNMSWDWTNTNAPQTYDFTIQGYVDSTHYAASHYVLLGASGHGGYITTVTFPTSPGIIGAAMYRNGVFWFAATVDDDGTGIGPFQVAIHVPANVTKGKISWQYVQNGDVLATYDTNPGDGPQTLYLSPPLDPSIYPVSEFIILGGHVFTDGEGFSFDVTSSNSTPLNTGQTITNSATTTTSAPNYDAQFGNDPIPGQDPTANDQRGLVWQPTTGAGSDALTIGVFKQGIDALLRKQQSGGFTATDSANLAAIKANTESLSGSGGGLTATDSANLEAVKLYTHTTESTLGIISSQLQTTDSLSATALTLSDSMPTSGTMSTAGNAASATLSSHLLTGSVTVSAITGSLPALTITMPAAFGGQTIDFNPFASDRLGNVASWIRTLILWIVVVHFGVWLATAYTEELRAYMTAPQAKGNPLLAGTGAQATGLIAAAAISAVILGAVVALTALIASLSFSSVTSAMTTQPWLSAPAGILQMIDAIFPIATACTLAAFRVLFKVSAGVTYGTMATIIRFIVP